MAKVYDIFGKKPTYDTDDLEKSEKSLYFKEIESLCSEISITMKSLKENYSCDPLNGILIIPSESGSEITGISLGKNDRISMREMASKFANQLSGSDV